MYNGYAQQREQRQAEEKPERQQRYPPPVELRSIVATADTASSTQLAAPVSSQRTAPSSFAAAAAGCQLAAAELAAELAWLPAQYMAEVLAAPEEGPRGRIITSN